MSDSTPMTRVGIIGVGGMGNVHARHLSRMPDVELFHFDKDPQRSRDFTAQYSSVVADSADDLISKCDVVDVCLPSDLHFEFAMKSVAAGRATFVEKPLTKTLAQGTQLVDAAGKAGVPLGTGQVVRFFPEFAAGHQAVVDGKIGKPAAARTRRGGTAPGRGADNWFMDHNRSGGVLIDLAVHDFDWLRWTLGEVKHLYSRSVGAKTMSGPDYALTTLTFESGAVAHVEATWMDPGGFRTTFEVCGSGGMVEFDSRLTPTLRTVTEGKTISEAPLSSADDAYYKELRGFLDAVQNGTEPPVTGFDGLMALSIAFTALESAQTGKVLAPPREF